MNHKTLVQNALDETVSYTEACELILSEIDSLKDSFNYILEGAMKEHQDQSTHRHEPPLTELHSVQSCSNRIQKDGIAINNFGVQTDLKRRGNDIYHIFPALLIRDTTLISDLKFVMGRNVYDSYLKM
jgi:hypothetical protein